MTIRAGLWLGLCAVLAGCVITTVQQPGPPPDPKTPPRLEGTRPPPLEPTQVPGIQRAVIDVPDVYYHAAKERWFRWAMDRWFVAFLWNGQWFPLEKSELPVELAALEPTREQKKERKLTREEELRKIDEELERLEAEERKAKEKPPASP
jgi:hypothetical protein